MSPGAYVLLVAGMGAVTYGPRALPLLALARRRLPAGVAAWLDYVAPAVLAALLAPGLLASPAPRHLDLGRPELWVAVPTLAFAWRTRSLGGTVAVGMALYWLLGAVAGT